MGGLYEYTIKLWVEIYMKNKIINYLFKTLNFYH